jgi:hypothetical protein
MRKRKTQSIRKTFAGGVAFGILFSVVSFFALTLLGAILLGCLKNPTGSVKPASLAVLILCAIISGFATSKYKGSGGVAAASVTALIFIALMIIASLIAGGGALRGMQIMNALCYVPVAILAAFIAKPRERRRRH